MSSVTAIQLDEKERTRLVETRAVSKSFQSTGVAPASVEVVRDISIHVNEGELVTVFGPNGCGKTTILNMLAGLTNPDVGEIRLTNGVIQPLAVGYVFQNYGDVLLPWRTVRGNLSFPLEIRGVSDEVRRERVQARLGQLNLSHHADKYVYQLSGGLKQLVAVAQATIYEPRLLLLDEPFSALDYSVSRDLWLRFRHFWADDKVSTLFVSHNVDEAVFLGDRIYVLSARPGRVVADITIPFGTERPISLLTSPEFFAVRKEVLDAFEDGRRL